MHIFKVEQGTAAKENIIGQQERLDL